MAYRDDMPLDEYLGFLEAHLREAHRVLRDDGSLYLHLDFHSAHHARLLLDDVFGPERFLNEIVWAYDYGGRPRDRWPRKHDTILWYAKGDRWTFNRDDIDRLPYMAPGLVGPEKAARGQAADRRLVDDDRADQLARTDGLPDAEARGAADPDLPASSNPGDLVLDFFCGSGTTGAVAKRLGRRYLLVDENPEAIEIARRRVDAVESAAGTAP